jgi:hypothetical protein
MKRVFQRMVWRLALGAFVAVVYACYFVGTALGPVWPRARYLRWMALERVAMRKADAGANGKARRLAEELLQVATGDRDYWDYGNAIHKANIVLGRVALREGDVDQAKYHLLQAGKTPGSPQLDSFGPNMTLAKELLEAGVRGTVLKYFALCGEFWEMDFGKLDHWSTVVKRGEIPEFGTQLLY